MSKGAGEYLVEFIQIGSSVKVSAIDTVSGREVSIVGPAKASRAQLTKVAVDKLKYVLAKEKS
ncbi:MAG: hypothetical protein KAI89_04015 [Emcibacter sp.]|nr:hypothetical protein [Emcibacter sp.]